MLLDVRQKFCYYNKMKVYQCSDRMCGATDCKTCHPENYRGNEYIGDETLEDIVESQRAEFREPIE